MKTRKRLRGRPVPVCPRASSIAPADEPRSFTVEVGAVAFPGEEERVGKIGGWVIYATRRDSCAWVRGGSHGWGGGGEPLKEDQEELTRHARRRITVIGDLRSEGPMVDQLSRTLGPSCMPLRRLIHHLLRFFESVNVSSIRALGG